MSNKEYLQQFLDSDTVEELLAETGRGTYRDATVVKFVKKFGLAAGTHRVPSYIIFMVYKKMFTAVRNSDKIRPTAFFRSFKQMFTQVRSGSQRYYMLNTDFDLEPDTVEQFEETYRKYHIRRKK